MMVVNRNLRVKSWLLAVTTIFILSSVYFMSTPAFASAIGYGTASMLQYRYASTRYNPRNSAQKIIVCTPNWSTGTWSVCVNGTRTRNVTDSKRCNSTVGKPSTTRTCTIHVCTQKWSTGAWSVCTNGNQTRAVTNSNNCGNLTGKPSTTRACKMPTGNNTTQNFTVCIPNWIAGSWSTCTGGSQTRNVTDSNKCGNLTGQPTTTQTCTMPIVNNTTQNNTPTPVHRNSLDTINFAGYTWDVKTSNGGLDDPGPNVWDNSADTVWVDTKGRLHMEIRKVGDKWYSSEVDMQKSLGYGKYVFTTESNVDNYDKNIVAAVFLYSFSSALNYPEVDIEYSKWGGGNVNNAWLSVQPVTQKSQDAFAISTASDNHLTNVIDWNSNRVIFQINDNNSVKRQWTYTGSNTPQSTDGQIAIINFWLYKPAPSDGQNAELIISNFTFIPNGA